MGLSHADKVRLVSTPVTLNGKPAAICGTLLSRAFVAELPYGMSAEWSWEAARRIVDTRGGAFNA